jgi:predicted ATP-dependent protease
VLASLRGFHRSLRKRLDFFGIVMSARDEFEIADDNRQKIVEIMRDSTGQLTDSL